MEVSTIVAYDWATSKEKVRRMIADGWEPIGGVSFSPEGTPHQAMVRRHTVSVGERFSLDAQVEVEVRGGCGRLSPV